MSFITPRAEGPQADPKSPQGIEEKVGSGNETGRPQSEQLAKQETLSSIDEKAALKTVSDPNLLANVSNGTSDENGVATGEDMEKSRTTPGHVDYSEAVNLNLNSSSQSRRRRRRATTIGSKRDPHGADEYLDKGRAEDLLSNTQGHLILWPYDWYVSTFASIGPGDICTDESHLGLRKRNKVETGSTLWTRFLLWRSSKLSLCIGSWIGY
jgi:phospholipase D1/2